MTPRWRYNRNIHMEYGDTKESKNFSNKEILDTKEQTQASTENLRSTTIDSSITSIDTRSSLTVQQVWLEHERDIHTFDWFLPIIDKLLQEIEDTRSWTSKKWLSKAWQRTMEEAKAKLKQYEKQLKGKRRALLKQKNVQIRDYDIANVRNIWDQINKIREDIGMWQWGEYSSIASYLCNSPENIRKAKKYQGDSLEFNQRVEQELKNAAIQNIFLRQSINAKDFYRRIAEWRYDEADYQLYITNSSILASSFQRCGITIPTNPTTSTWSQTWWNKPSSYESWNNWQTRTWNWWRRETTSQTTSTSVDYSNTDWWETFQKWWIAWLFDKLLTNCSNMTQWQKWAWKTLWILGIVWWVIYWQYKFYTSEKIWLWTKIWLTVLPVFATQFLTWKDPITLFAELLTWWFSMSEIKNKYGNALWWLSSSWSETAKATVPAVQAAMVFNSEATAGDAQRMTQSFKADNRNRTTFYQQSCTKIQREYWSMAVESFRATFSENFDEKKWNEWLSSFWVTSWTGNREPIYSLADNAYTNQTLLEKYLEENHLKITENPTKKAELNNFIQRKNTQNELISNNDLKSHTDWFIPVQQPQQETNPQSPTQTTNNPQAPEQQRSQEIEVTQETLKYSVNKWLSKIFKHFRSKYWKKINYIKVNEKHIPTYLPWITSDILSRSIKKNWNSVTIDISDSNIKTIYDNAVEKLAQSQGGLLNTFWTLSKEIREHKRDNIKAFRQKWQMSDYNERKNNVTDIIKILFEDIARDLESQWWNIKITRNWQDFNNIADAISAQQILN